MNTTHSPGPWEVVDGHYPCFKDVKGPSFKISAVMWATDLTEDDYQQRKADLNLIAAAPSLLEALIAAEKKLLQIEHMVGGGDDEISVEVEILAARAAIAAATGAA